MNTNTIYLEATQTKKIINLNFVFEITIEAPRRSQDQSKYQVIAHICCSESEQLVFSVLFEGTQQECNTYYTWLKDKIELPKNLIRDTFKDDTAIDCCD